ncbi:RTA1 like protein-domain-containing protein [Ilyonectria robusta]|uniref:RTA1 like protein-domain-containing protein n=1 Tax=Ilyonectria robusta TaxID=1079257 RepID=UPI001E8D1DB1|nr:RTA1 like protein-domain-containing protein [Ilyonectria robusta]KAH8663894.1 RTA1 like protein-domain-containing protein [Ilyonectria robusta]
MYLFDREGQAPEEGAGAVFKLYHYDPTIAGGVVFVLLFTGTTLLHFWQLIHARSWFLIPMAIGGLFEIIGYAARCKSGNESPDWTLGPYIMQAILLLVAPALFAATIYMELGRIITMVDGEGHTLIPKKWMTKIFVIGDVVSFFLQGGGSLAALQNGAKVIIGGLFVQLICFGVFICIAVAFHRSILASPTSRSKRIPWKKHMMALYVGSMLIMVRSIFRAIEYLQGFDGYLLRHELYLYVFDALLMFSVMVLFNWVHPAEITAILKGRDMGSGWKMDAVPNSHRRLRSEA